MKINISLSFWVIIAILISLNGIKVLLFLLFSCFIHELGHIAFIKMFSIKIEKINLSIIGGSIKSYNLQYSSHFKLLLIYSIGVFLNFILGIFCNFIAMNGFYSYNFFILSGINLFLGIFNSIPIKNLDGYNFLYNLLMCFNLNSKSVLLFCECISLVCNFLLIICGVFLLKYGNFSLLIVALAVFYSSFENYYYF